MLDRGEQAKAVMLSLCQTSSTILAMLRKATNSQLEKFLFS